MAGVMLFGFVGRFVYVCLSHVFGCRCGGSGECICYAGYTGADCSVEMAEDTCACGQFEGDCQGACDMLVDCSGHGR